MNTKKAAKGKKVHSVSQSWDDFMRDELADTGRAQAYLEVAIDEFRGSGKAEDFLQALRFLAKSKGGIAEVARKTGLNRESLYRTLSRRGNPQFRTVLGVIDALGMRVRIEPASKRRTA
jgi:probable addiction module antidote protein